MEVNIKNSSERFVELIKNSPDIIKISFLQLLQTYADADEKIFELLLGLTDQHENYLVKANAYSVLENLKL